ncbi:TPA: hypothetical protein U1D18_002086 [Streptococcus suis]|nr:hypothetical protein [Streptococcus suis]
MRTLDFNDLLTDYNDLKWLVYKQLAFGRYMIEGTVCKVIVNSEKEGCLEVQIDTTFKNKEIADDIDKNIHLVSKEPAVRYLVSSLRLEYRNNNNWEMKNENNIFLFFLEKYKKRHTKNGCDLETVEILKLYSPKKELLNNDKRENYGAGFIDYEEQICNQGANPIIHNEGGLNGIWASTKAGFNNSISEENRNDFGSSLFILKPLKDCQYFIFPVKSDGDFSGAKEIIGDRFQVVKKLELPNDIKEWEQVVSVELEKFNSDTGKKIGLLRRTLERFFTILDYFRVTK